MSSRFVRINRSRLRAGGRREQRCARTRVGAGGEHSRTGSGRVVADGARYVTDNFKMNAAHCVHTEPVRTHADDDFIFTLAIIHT